MPPVKRDLGKINGGHAPSAPSQPERVSALAAGQVKRSTRSQRLGTSPTRNRFGSNDQQRVGVCIACIPRLTIHTRIFPVAGAVAAACGGLIV